MPVPRGHKIPQAYEEDCAKDAAAFANVDILADVAAPAEVAVQLIQRFEAMLARRDEELFRRLDRAVQSFASMELPVGIAGSVWEKTSVIVLSGTAEQRVSAGVALLTLVAGVFHFLQGILMPSACADMCLQPWFMACAGLWMTGSALLFLYDEMLGFPFMAASMGGAAATALLSPQKPGVIVAMSSLAAQAYTTKLPQDPSYIAVTVGMFVFAVLARQFLGGSDDSQVLKKATPDAMTYEHSPLVNNGNDNVNVPMRSKALVESRVRALAAKTRQLEVDLDMDIFSAPSLEVCDRSFQGVAGYILNHDDLLVERRVP
ncbi:Scn11a [Symbiodinium microadriaticum]|nr:Scn11a [Symbiodinium microadriaticum]